MGIKARLSIIVSAMIVIAAIIVGVVVWQSRPKPVVLNADTVAVVGNHQISEIELAQYTADDTSRSDALAAVMTKYLYEDLGRKYGVTVTDAQIGAQFTAQYQDVTSQVALHRAALESTMLKQAIETKLAGTTMGKLYLITFNAAMPSTNIGEKVVMTSSEQRQFTADSALAKSKTDAVYNALKAGTLTMDQVIAQAQADPKFGVTAQPNVLSSGSFSTGDANDRLGNFVKKHNETLDALNKLKPGETSPIITLNKVLDPANTSNVVPVQYAIIQLSSSSKTAGVTFDQAVSTQRALGFKVVKS